MPGAIEEWKIKRQMPQKGAEMAYKKPQIVAKSAAKQSFVAGCPEKVWGTGTNISGACGQRNERCMIGSMR